MYCTEKRCLCQYVNYETGECDYIGGCAKEVED